MNKCIGDLTNMLMHTAKSLKSCPTFCDPKDCSPPDSSVHRILQARMMNWVAVPSSRGPSQLRDGAEPMSLMFPALPGKFFTTVTTWEARDRD